MYKIYNEEQKDGSYKYWVTITKVDAAILSKRYITGDNLKYIVKINEQLIKSDESTDFITIEDEEVISFITSQDWLYNYDKFNELNSYELNLAVEKLEALLDKENERLDSLLKSTLPSDEYTAILEYIMININKYAYQFYSLMNLQFEKLTKELNSKNK